MKITPKYPAKALKEPYYQGYITGSIFAYGFLWALDIGFISGLILMTIAIIFYVVQTNKIDNKD